MIRNFLRAVSLRVQKAWVLFTRGLYFGVTKFPIALIYFVGLYFNYKLLTRLTQDTTSITNVAFGIVAALGALSFSAASSVRGDEEAKDQFINAGERFLHAAIFLITASLLKYAAREVGVSDFRIKLSEFVWSKHWRVGLVGIPLGAIVAVLFFFALNSAHEGLRVLNRLLWHRLGDPRKLNKLW